MKTHDHLGKLSQVVNQLEHVEKVVVIPFVHKYGIIILHHETKTNFNNLEWKTLI